MVIQVMVVGWSGVMLPSIFGVVIIHHNPVHYCNWVNLSNVATCFKMNSPMTGFPLGIVLNYSLGLVCSRPTQLWPDPLWSFELQSCLSFLSTRPNLTKLLAMWFAQEQPEFPYTTVQLVCICLTASTFVLNFVTSASLNAWINAKRTARGLARQLNKDYATKMHVARGLDLAAATSKPLPVWLLVWTCDTRTATTMDPPSSSGRSHRGFGEKTHMFDG